MKGLNVLRMCRYETQRNGTRKIREKNKRQKKHKRQKQQEVTTFMFTNETLRAAIHEYCTPSTKQATIEKYGHIQTGT